MTPTPTSPREEEFLLEKIERIIAGAVAPYHEWTGKFQGVRKESISGSARMVLLLLAQERAATEERIKKEKMEAIKEFAGRIMLTPQWNEKLGCDTATAEDVDIALTYFKRKYNES